jgi:hypothetical protein
VGSFAQSSLGDTSVAKHLDEKKQNWVVRIDQFLIFFIKN